MSSPTSPGRAAGLSSAPLVPLERRRRAALHRSVVADGLGTAIPFLDAVDQQMERMQQRHDSPRVGCEGATTRFARAYMLLTAALVAHGDQLAIDAPARALVDHPAIYAAFVQNVDLLFAIRSPAADAVAYLLAAALDR